MVNENAVLMEPVWTLVVGDVLGVAKKHYPNVPKELVERAVLNQLGAIQKGISAGMTDWMEIVAEAVVSTIGLELKICPVCDGKGELNSALNYPPHTQCAECLGEGYVK